MDYHVKTFQHKITPNYDNHSSYFCFYSVFKEVYSLLSLKSSEKSVVLMMPISSFAHWMQSHRCKSVLWFSLFILDKCYVMMLNINLWCLVTLQRVICRAARGRYPEANQGS